MPNIQFLRQNSYGHLELKNRGSWFIAISHLLLLPSAISCLAVEEAHTGGFHACSDDYFMELNTFLRIAGIWQIVTAAIAFTIAGINVRKPDTLEIDIKFGVVFYCPYIFWYTYCIYAVSCLHTNQYLFSNLLFALFLSIFLFTTFRANVGFCIWAQQLDKACRQEDIAHTMMAWCVIQIAMIPMVIVMYMLIMWVATRHAKMAVQKALQDREPALMSGDDEEQELVSPVHEDQP